MAHRRCLMGCRLELGQTAHAFPKDPKRRAEWCRILGVYPRTKHVCLCSAHFHDCYIFGNRLSKFAIPKPPESRKTNSMFCREPIFQINDSFYRIHETSHSTTPVRHDDHLVTFPETESTINVKEIIADSRTQDPLSTSEDLQFSCKNKNKTDELQENIGKVEDFEIRKGSTNDMIIKGRYVQTNDYLVVSYTPPRKWTLQEQVYILDEKCGQQLKKIRQLNKENYRLATELKKWEKLLPKLRHLQTQNRFIYAELKMYKLKEKALRERRKKKRLNNRDIIQMEANGVET